MKKILYAFLIILACAGFGYCDSLTGSSGQSNSVSGGSAPVSSVVLSPSKVPPPYSVPASAYTSAVAITGGAIDGTPIGTITPSTINATSVTASGTGSFADIITKGPWVDVRAFGAKCDGNTDDYTALQAALTN